MAELVIGPLVSMVKEKASSYLLDQYKVMEGMEEQRKILERKLPAILYIIQDAEEKGAFQPGVSAWLRDLKTVSYEANGVFDEFKYEALRREAEKKGHNRIKALTSYPARNPIVFRYRMGKKLRRVVQTIEVLVTEMNTFGFRHMQQAPPSSKQWRKTDPIMVDTDKDIISKSREKEKKEIMKILLDEASSMDLTVLPIFGMGGLGKTTFVQLIYNDPTVQNHFELRRWYCVSDDGFDAAKIASNICQSNVSDNRGPEKALQDLQSLLSGKRYLIVLDDVWNLNDDMWGKLKSCLRHGENGSVVLTTTRNEEIARRMTVGVAGAHKMEKLNDEYLKEIVESRAFSLQRPNSNELDVTVDMIVDRCRGSPLAAKAFGSMLSTKTSMNEWKDILTRTNICTERTGILPILKLSFDDLPSHMKQCFAFCAIFPKDYEIDVEMLIQLWMAHDLIPVHEDDHLEIKGEEIFKELTWRSFFQDVNQTRYGGFCARFSFKYRTTCKIHDLMHDIAQSVMKKECVTMVDTSSMKRFLADPTRHIFVEMPRYREQRKFWDEFVKKQSPTLQTLLCSGGYSQNTSVCTSLRALQVFGTEYEVQVKHLHHLRYLNLTANVRLKRLPEDISILYNLQTLDLSGCGSIRQLPKDMKYMTSLRHLYTNGCHSLTCMPPGIGQMTCLQTLTYFVVGGNSGCSTIEELRNLKLGGELQLNCIENVTEAQAKEARLENKEKLTHLSLQWNDESQEELVQDGHKKVLCALKPNDCLQMLSIVNYKGTGLPSWISDLSLLTELHLLDCVLCDEFPQFSQFKALRALYLEKLDKLQTLCSDDTSVTFLALKKLMLCDLGSLERWVAIEGKEVKFPILESLTIMNCPKLSTLPEAPNLKNIQLDEGKSLLSSTLFAELIHHMPSLSTLALSTHDVEEATPPPQIDPNHELLSVSELELRGCNFFFSPNNPSQSIFGAWKWFEKLVTLTIDSCDALIYWPKDVFECLVLLKQLQILSCNKLIGRTPVRVGESTQTAEQVLPHLSTLSIWHCESLEGLFILPPSLSVINIDRCPRLEFIWGTEEDYCGIDVIQLEYCRDLASTSTQEQSPPPTNHHPCLKYLEISSCDNLAILPNLPPSLERLRIANCKKLCSVSASGHLDALCFLKISYCGKLQSLDSWGDLPSLRDLDLERCPCLASLPGILGNYSALESLRIRYCSAIDLKPLYRRHQQRLNSLEVKHISHAHSSNLI